MLCKTKMLPEQRIFFLQCTTVLLNIDFIWDDSWYKKCSVVYIVICCVSYSAILTCWIGLSLGPAVAQAKARQGEIILLTQGEPHGSVPPKDVAQFQSGCDCPGLPVHVLNLGPVSLFQFIHGTIGTYLLPSSWRLVSAVWWLRESSWHTRRQKRSLQHICNPPRPVQGTCAGCVLLWIVLL